MLNILNGFVHQFLHLGDGWLDSGSKAGVLAGLFFLLVLGLMLFAQGRLSAYYAQPYLLANVALLPIALLLTAAAAT